MTLAATLFSLGFAALRLPPGSVLSEPRATVHAQQLKMQMPDLGKMGSNLMNQMGLGDNAGLSKEEAEAMEGRLKDGKMSFDDFLKQIQVMQKAGNLQAMMQKNPFGGNGGNTDEQLREGERKLKRYSDFVEVMGEEDRADPTALIAEAKLVRGGAPPDKLKTLAEAASSSVEDVGQFVTEFAVMRKAAVAFANGEDPNTVKQMMIEEQQASRPPMNRAMRRQASKQKKKAPAKSGGFGRR